MKRIIAVLLVALALVPIATQSIAQVEEEYLRVPHRVTVSGHGGLGIPSNPSGFSSLWNTSWPVSLNIGFSVFSWLEIGGGFNYWTSGISGITAKEELGIVGTSAIEGGTVSSLEYFGTARFVAVPGNRVNPFAHVSLGAFRVTAEDLVSEEGSSGPTPTPEIVRSMQDVNGIHVATGAGLQYAMNAQWSSYAMFVWNINLTNDFNPTTLVTLPDLPQPEGDTLQYGAVLVGLMLKL